jgi:hypothetical protein
MYFDTERNAYVDRDSGEVVFQENHNPSHTIHEGDIHLNGVHEDAKLADPENGLFTMEDHNGYGSHPGYEHLSPNEKASNKTASTWDDWTLARALQALEFEIPQETDPFEDFNNKEYRASRSCTRQFLTLSFFICIVQVKLPTLASHFFCSYCRCPPLSLSLRLF